MALENILAVSILLYMKTEMLKGLYKKCQTKSTLDIILRNLCREKTLKKALCYTEPGSEMQTARSLAYKRLSITFDLYLKHKLIVSPLIYI